MIVIPRWITAIILYLLIIFAIFAFKPSLFFDMKGHPKNFGVGFTEGNSIFALSFMLPVIAFICFFISVWLQFALG